MADEDALVRCVRRCEHRSRTGRQMDDEEEASTAAAPANGDDDDDESPRPFRHPPLPSLHYFLHDHLGQTTVTASSTTPTKPTATDSSTDAVNTKQHFFRRTLPVLQRVALQMPTLFPDGRLRRLRANPDQGSEAHFSRRQLLCLIAHMVSWTSEQAVCALWLILRLKTWGQ